MQVSLNMERKTQDAVSTFNERRHTVRTCPSSLGCGRWGSATETGVAPGGPSLVSSPANQGAAIGAALTSRHT